MEKMYVGSFASSHMLLPSDHFILQPSSDKYISKTQILKHQSI